MYMYHILSTALKGKFLIKIVMQRNAHMTCMHTLQYTQINLCVMQEWNARQHVNMCYTHGLLQTLDIVPSCNYNAFTCVSFGICECRDLNRPYIHVVHVFTLYMYWYLKYIGIICLARKNIVYCVEHIGFFLKLLSCMYLFTCSV